MSSQRKSQKRKDRVPVSPDYVNYHRNKRTDKRSSTDCVNSAIENDFDSSPEVIADNNKSALPTKTNFFRMADLTNIGAVFRASLQEDETKEMFKQILQPILDQQTNDIVTKQTKVLETKIKALENDNKRLETKVIMLEIKFDKLEQYSRKNNVILVGMKPTNVPLDIQVTSLLKNEMDVKIEPHQIAAVHQLGKNSPAILLKLTNNDIKRTIMVAKSKLRTARTKIYINDDLTKTRIGIFKAAREHVKAKTLAAAYTRNGTIFIKKNLDSKPTEINTITEVEHLANNGNRPNQA